MATLDLKQYPNVLRTVRDHGADVRDARACILVWQKTHVRSYTLFQQLVKDEYDVDMPLQFFLDVFEALKIDCR